MMMMMMSYHGLMPKKPSKVKVQKLKKKVPNIASPLKVITEISNVEKLHMYKLIVTCESTE